MVKQSAQETFFNRLSSPVKQMERLPGFYHAIFHEKERQRVVSKAGKFIRECFQQAPQRDFLIEADKHGFTRDEFDRLCRPGNPLFGLTRFMIKTAGQIESGDSTGLGGWFRFRPHAGLRL